MIQWLRDKRRQQPSAPLSSLLDVAPLSLDKLTDIACIDLIERRRLGQSITVEDLLGDVPQLQPRDAAKLDLIDAEICVCNELGIPVDPSDYRARFPDLAHEIEALIRLTHDTRNRPPIQTPLAQTPLNQALEQEATRVDRRGSTHGVSSALEFTFEPPSWFTSEHLHSSTEDGCLIRGRDSHGNRAVAMKVLRLKQGEARNATATLASVESAAMVNHPAWVGPDVAAIDKNSLAIIRPWIFGTRWDQARRHASVATRLRDVARIGYALQAAHHTATKDGCATHGGIHMNNLIVDADGQVKLIDALASLMPPLGDSLGDSLGDFPKASSPPATDAHEPANGTHVRRLSDVRSLCALLRLVTTGSFATDPDHRRRVAILDRLCERILLQPDNTDACGIIADAVSKLADGTLRERDTIRSHGGSGGNDSVHRRFSMISLWKQLIGH
jgi:hypothetical protein